MISRKKEAYTQSLENVGIFHLIYNDIFIIDDYSSFSYLTI